MAVELTGTPVAITWGTEADPTGQSITIPSDATAVYMFWAYYVGFDDAGISTATLGGEAGDQSFAIVTAPSDRAACGVIAWYNPPTGSQTLDVAWTETPSSGPVTMVAYVKGGNTTAWTDADAAAADSTAEVSVTLTTVVGDLVLKCDQSSGGVPPNSAGWTDGPTMSNNNQHARLASIVAAATTQACPSEEENFSSIVAVAIPAAPTGDASAGGTSSASAAGTVVVETRPPPPYTLTTVTG